MARALVVEDSRLWRELLAMILTSMGYDCDCVETRGEAQQKRDVYDVVILDLALPDSTGIEALTRLRPIFRRAAICVVSGYISETDVMGIIAKGADMCAHKPITVERFKRDVSEAVKRRMGCSGDAMKWCQDRLGEVTP